MEFLERVAEASTAGSYPGSRSAEEIVNKGFLILDKWRGPTSHDATATLKKVLSLDKAGHSGTLDPQVSGVLPILTGSATKAMPVLQRLDKEYVGVMHIHKEASDEQLRKAITIGVIKQKPPVKSAVARRVREREVHSFDILDIDGKDVAFKVRCEAGTYIRVLCHDIGKQLGGAHMKELRRTAVGPFTEERAVRMQDIADAAGTEKIKDLIKPVESAMEAVKKVFIRDAALRSVSHGSPLYAAGITKLQNDIQRNDLVCVFSGMGEAVALGNAALDSKEMTKKKSLAVKIDRVLKAFD